MTLHVFSVPMHSGKSYGLTFLISVKFPHHSVENSSLMNWAIRPNALHSFILGITSNLTSTSPTHLTVCHRSNHPVILPQTLRTHTSSECHTGHWPRIPRLSGLCSVTHHYPDGLASALSPKLFTWDGEGGSSWLCASGHSDAEKRVCLSAEARTSLDNGHILQRDCGVDQWGGR